MTLKTEEVEPAANQVLLSGYELSNYIHQNGYNARLMRGIRILTVWTSDWRDEMKL